MPDDLTHLRSLLHPQAGSAAIPLWPDNASEGPLSEDPEYFREPELGHLACVHRPSMLRFIPSTPNGGAVIVSPGGGYHILSVVKEGRAVADWLCPLGFHVFVLKYRLREYKFPAQLRDIARAIRLVRSRAPEWGIDPARIGAMGFSAGGHLTAMAATLHDRPEAKGGDALDVVSARPDWAALIYPLISMCEPLAHGESRLALLGPEASGELCELTSPERQVRSDSPPMFILHARDDRVCDLRHAREMFAALGAAGVPAELHVTETGGHGFGLGGPPWPVSRWTDKFETWLRARGEIDDRL